MSPFTKYILANYRNIDSRRLRPVMVHMSGEAAKGKHKIDRSRGCLKAGIVKDNQLGVVDAEYAVESV